MSINNLPNRMLEVIQAKTGSKRRFKEMEELTNIPSDRWSAFSLGRQRPTAEMIEAVCKEWPQFSFWMVTGITDPERGHVAPSSIDSHYPVPKGIEQQHATAEFKYLIAKLESEPSDEDGKAVRRREIDDGILAMREKDILPAIYVSYEKIVRELGEIGKSEFFILESNAEIQEIRKLRNEEEGKIRKPIQDWRANLITSKKINQIIQILLTPFKSKK